MKSLETGVILREQKNRPETIAAIAGMLMRLKRLYQIPNFDERNAVELAEWIAENYSCEEPDTIEMALRNPPSGSDTNWRLTPDTINKWMAPALEAKAIEREKAHEAVKKETINEELPGVDYDAFRRRIAAEPPRDPRKGGFDDPTYQEQKAEYLRQRLLAESKQPEQQQDTNEKKS